MAEKKNPVRNFKSDPETEKVIVWLVENTHITVTTLIKLALVAYARSLGYGVTVESAITERKSDALAATKEELRAPSHPAPKPGTATPKGTIRK